MNGSKDALLLLSSEVAEYGGRHRPGTRGDRVQVEATHLGAEPAIRPQVVGAQIQGIVAEPNGRSIWDDVVRCLPRVDDVAAVVSIRNIATHEQSHNTIDSAVEVQHGPDRHRATLVIHDADVAARKRSVLRAVRNRHLDPG